MSSAMTQPVDQTSGEREGGQSQFLLSTTKGRRGEGRNQVVWLTNLGGIVGRAKNQLRRSVVPRANVRHVGLVLDEDLSATKITQF